MLNSSFLALVGIIWKGRNARCFEGKCTKIQALEEKLKLWKERNARC